MSLSQHLRESPTERKDMERRSLGGMLNTTCFLRESDRNQAREIRFSLASSTIREAAKIGLQSLYADADEVLEKYKDFDIVKEMKERKGNFLWVRARAIDADVVNANGDYFSEAELLKDVEDQQGNKMPSYKTFEGVPIYTNHKNDDITQAKGMVVYAEWDDQEKCVWCTFIVDEEAYPDIGRGIRTGIMHDVSMGCFNKDVRIPTNNGFKCISEVEDIDLLLDSDGEYVSIVNRQEYDHWDTMHTITLEGGAQIKCTYYHPFLTFTKEQWAGRKSLKRPVVDGRKASLWVANEIEPQYTRTQDLNVGDVFLSPIGGTEAQDPDFTPGKARLAGLFLAEGTYASNKRQRVLFCLHADERDTLGEEIISLLQSELGVAATASVRHTNNSCYVSACGATAFDWFLENCGRYSKKKALHPKWLTAPYDIQATLYGGYFDGDGEVTHDKRSDHDYLRSSTISRDLHEQLSLILTRLGVHHSSYYNYRGRRFDYLEAMAETEVNLSHVIQIPSSYSHFLVGKTTKQFAPSDFFAGKHTYNNWLGRKIVSIDVEPIEHEKVYTFQTETGNYLALNFISKNCQVASGTCSECGHKANTEKEYCECLKKHKGKNHPKSKKKVYEKNHDLKFIELSVVGDGAFDSCEIQEIYDVDEIIHKASSILKRAEQIGASVVVATSFLPNTSGLRHVYEDALRQVTASTAQTVRLAQQAGTLVGGQLMAGEGANQNTTVANILQFLGIDAASGLNIMDMLNLALNFLEVAVMNLFARRDNIDLAHVAKITKSMGDLQSTMQDMIDDGVNSSGGSNGTPLNQGQQGQQGGAQAGPGANVPLQGQQQQQADYIIPGSVGRGMFPAAPQQQVPILPMTGIGGGTLASAKRPMMVWASADENAPREIVASTQREVVASRDTRGSKMLGLAESLFSFAQTLEHPLGVNEHNPKDYTFKDLKDLASTGQSSAANAAFTANYSAGRAAGTKSTQPVKAGNKTNAPKVRATGESKLDNLNPFKRFAQQRRIKQAAKASIDFKVEDDNGNRVILSSDGSFSAYQKGVRVAWEPVLSEAQLTALDSEDGYGIAHELLEEFRTASRSGKTVLAAWTPETESEVKELSLGKKRTGTDDDVREHLLENGAPGQALSKRTGTDDDVREHLLESKRTGTDDDVREHLLENAGLYKQRGIGDWSGSANEVKELLIEDARHGYPDEVIERQLDRVRKTYGPGEPNLVVECALKALGHAVVTAKVTPDEIVDAAEKLASREDLADLIKLASLGTKHRRAIAARRSFHKMASAELAAESAVLDALGAAITETVLAADLSDAIVVASSEHAKTAKSVTRIAKSLLGDNTDFEPAAVRSTVSRAERLRAALATQADKTDENLLAKDHLKAALSALAMAASNTGAHPKEVVASISESDSETLLAEVEMARTASRMEARLTARARAEFYGNARTASKSDVHNGVVGWLADYAEAYSFPTVAIVHAAVQAGKFPKVAEEHVAKAIIASQTRTAAIQVTDEKTTSKRIVCTVSDLGGIDPKSEDFESQFRQRAIEIMASAGYQVDPSTFALTELTVNGESVMAAVTTRLSKTFEADSGSGAAMGIGMDAATDGGGIGGGETPYAGGPGEANMDDQSVQSAQTPQVSQAMPDGPVEQGDTIMTASAKAARHAKRNEILARYAQAAPGGMGGAGGMGAGGAGGAAPDPMMGGSGIDGAADGLGMSALTNPSAAGGNPEGEDADTDAMSEPGEPQPWGTICPNCGGKDVDVANGEGNCQSCGAKIEYTFQAMVKPNVDKDKNGASGGDDKEADAGAPPPLGGDTGLGAATAPGVAGGAPAAPAGGAAAPSSMMMQASWESDPDAFIRTAMADFDRKAERVLPVGMICPSCGNREASKVKDRTYCYECGTLAISEVKASVNPSKVRVAIRWII